MTSFLSLKVNVNLRPRAATQKAVSALQKPQVDSWSSSFATCDLDSDSEDELEIERGAIQGLTTIGFQAVKQTAEKHEESEEKKNHPKMVVGLKRNYQDFTDKRHDDYLEQLLGDLTTASSTKRAKIEQSATFGDESATFEPKFVPLTRKNGVVYTQTRPTII